MITFSRYDLESFFERLLANHPNAQACLELFSRVLTTVEDRKIDLDAAREDVKVLKERIAERNATMSALVAKYERLLAGGTSDGEKNACFDFLARQDTREKIPLISRLRDEVKKPVALEVRQAILAQGVVLESGVLSLCHAKEIVEKFLEAAKDIQDF